MAGKSEIDIFIAKEVKKRRKAKGITQQNLSIQLGFSEGFVGNIENINQPEKYNPTHLNSAAKILECSPKDFWPDKPL